MPAYFSIDIVFDRNSLEMNTVDELSFYLRHAGLRFKNCTEDWTKFTERDMIIRNQDLLEKDHDASTEQDRCEGFVQAEYELEGFSGVRGFFLNSFPEDSEFTYELVIPEDEVFYDEDEYAVKEEAAERILRLITNIWHMPSVQTIQTCSESNGETVSASYFSEWKRPAANPYALVSEIQLKSIPTDSFDVGKFHIGGVILTNRNYFFK